MKRHLSLVLLVLLAVAAFAVAEDEGTQKTCPVMGNAINKEVYTDYKDMRIFFCCAGCDKPFNADPSKFLAVLAQKGEKPMKLAAQSVCPVSGEELITRELFVEANGKKIYVCREGCTGKVKEDPAKFAKVIADRGEYLESAK